MKIRTFSRIFINTGQ